MTSERERLDRAKHGIRALDARIPKVGLVLGSGLGAVADALVEPVRVAYADVPSMPRASVAGHAGQLRIGRLGSVVCAALEGRVHLYEGHPPSDVVFPVRLLRWLGCETVILTNAAGGLDPNQRPGTLLTITDHLNLTGTSPLLGPVGAELGTRFPDMSEVYSAELRQLAKNVAAGLGIPLAEGVYAGMLGPSYETPAEIRMLRTLGADAVGMSTVLEAIALRHLGARVLGISCITNLAAGLSPTPLDHHEVQAAGAAASASLAALLAALVEALA